MSNTTKFFQREAKERDLSIKSKTGKILRTLEKKI